MKRPGKQFPGRFAVGERQVPHGKGGQHVGEMARPERFERPTLRFVV